MVLKFFDLEFNEEEPSTMHIDINSCFASIEQQFEPRLRNKPIVVVAREHESGCIVAPSIQAKKYGIKVGMRVFEARKICPQIIPIKTDPPKYRFIHQKLKCLLENYTDDLHPKSIDEFVLNLKHFPAFKVGMEKTAIEIKSRIKKEIGECISVSIGIAPNRFLAKTGAGLKKPDGLDTINWQNYKETFSKLNLRDLCGINIANESRLNSVGIYSTVDFYNADYLKLISAFKSIEAYYWYLRLRGWEIDDFESNRSSFSQSYVLHNPSASNNVLIPILQKLVEKMGFRLRQNGYCTKGVYIYLKYTDKSSFTDHKIVDRAIFDSIDIFKILHKLMSKRSSIKIVRAIGIGCFHLVKIEGLQLEIFNNVESQLKLVETVDKINSKWGRFTATPGWLINGKSHVPDAISFGMVEE